MNEVETQAADAAPHRRTSRRLSQVFSEIAHEAQDRVSIASIRDKLGERSFAALLVFFAAINLIPVPPGTSAILGLPLLIISLQMVYGSRRVWLPVRLGPLVLPVTRLAARSSASPRQAPLPPARRLTRVL